MVAKGELQVVARNTVDTAMLQRRYGLLQVLGSLLRLARLGGEELRVDKGKDTTLADGDTTEQLVELFVVANRELQVPWDAKRGESSVEATTLRRRYAHSALLVVAGGVTSKLENLGCQVFEHRSEVDGGTSTDTLAVVAAAEETVDTTDGELETGLGRSRGRLCCRVASFSTFST